MCIWRKMPDMRAGAQLVCRSCFLSHAVVCVCFAETCPRAVRVGGGGGARACTRYEHLHIGTRLHFLLLRQTERRLGLLCSPLRSLLQPLFLCFCSCFLPFPT